LLLPAPTGGIRGQWPPGAEGSPLWDKGSAGAHWQSPLRGLARSPPSRSDPGLDSPTGPPCPRPRLPLSLPPLFLPPPPTPPPHTHHHPHYPLEFPTLSPTRAKNGRKRKRLTGDTLIPPRTAVLCAASRYLPASRGTSYHA